MLAKSKKIKKVHRQNIFFYVLFGVLLFGVMSFLVVSNWKINQKRAEYNAQIENLQEQLQELETKRQQLQSQISQTSGEAYLEEQARERLNLKKPGEEVVSVLPAEETTIKEIEKGFWKQIWDRIKFW